MKYLLIVLAFVLLLIAILFAKHKCAFLIAGYNTLSKDEKAKVDKDKLTSVSAKIMAGFSLTMFTGAFDMSIMALMMVAMVTFTLGFVIFGQRYILNDAGKAEYDKKSHALYKVIASFFAFGFIIFLTLILFTGDIEVDLKDRKLSFRAMGYDMIVDVDRITNYDTVETFDIGYKANGFSNAKICSGHFKNDEFGRYELFAYTDAKEYLIIEYENTHIVYGASEEAIKGLLDELEEGL